MSSAYFSFSSLSGEKNKGQERSSSALFPSPGNPAPTPFSF